MVWKDSLHGISWWSFLLILVFISFAELSEGASFELDISHTEATIDPRGLDASINESFSVQIRNNDVIDDDYIFNVFDESDHFTITFNGDESYSVHLLPAEEDTINLIVTANEETLGGLYPFNMSVNSSDEGKNVQFNITALAPLIEISPADIRLNTEQDKYYYNGIEIRVWNNGTSEIKSINLSMTFDGVDVGIIKINSINKNGYHASLFEFDVPSKGTHYINVSTSGAFPSELHVSKVITIESPPQTHNGDDDDDDDSEINMYIIIGVILCVVVGLIIYRKKR